MRGSNQKMEASLGEMGGACVMVACSDMHVQMKGPVSRGVVCVSVRLSSNELMCCWRARVKKKWSARTPTRGWFYLFMALGWLQGIGVLDV